jgi:hypothetical protein
LDGRDKDKSHEDRRCDGAEDGKSKDECSHRDTPRRDFQLAETGSRRAALSRTILPSRRQIAFARRNGQNVEVTG